MKHKLSMICALILAILVVDFGSASAQKKKVAQSGMTYLNIGLSARQSGMGNASVASVRGEQGLFYNPAAITQIEDFSLVINQVNWLVDTHVYGMGAILPIRNWGTLGLDVVYMDYGTIIGTKRVDKSVDDRGYITTGDIGVEDYAIGLTYAYAVNDRFSFGTKLKIAHESLGHADYAIGVIDEENDEFVYANKEWKLNQWGIDFGGYYDTGFRSLVFAVAFQNFSRDMVYWTEKFQMPLVLKMGLAADMNQLMNLGFSDVQINASIDAMHPIDYTEQVNLGGELVYKNQFALRSGYQFNQDTENLSFGFGLNFNYSGTVAHLDYSFTQAEYFEDINRFSLSFSF
ncbi:MAG: PorV/PorQ family protein [Deferribacteres bacterium]|nr:PorV/PorQ family protein [candidate division KSB1 bacterium]MCB9500526.1 PorV/PorQ family protein [Deferribacteres bacterium]